MVDDLCEEEVRAGSRTMTLKYGLLGLPQGGAKAGVAASGDAPASEKRRALEEFARAAGSLVRDRRYVPDADMGTSAADIRWMMKAVGARVAPREWKENRSGLYTAQSCVAAALAVLERRGAPLEGCRVAIEGFGSVGAPLAALLRSRGARVVAISTSCGALYRPDGLDVDRLFRRAAEVGSRFVEDEPEAI
jgi:glutamate dehydrogenase (NAD(P)+)